MFRHVLRALFGWRRSPRPSPITMSSGLELKVPAPDCLSIEPVWVGPSARWSVAANWVSTGALREGASSEWSVNLLMPEEVTDD